MARNYARIPTSIWEDDDWRALGAAQHLFLLILGQPKLSLAGSIDVKPKSWARMGGLTVGQVVSALDTLIEAGFVVVDDDTDELVIRTFTQDDNVTANGNLVRGMWSAWSAIESPMLKACVLAHMPEKAFEPRFEPLSEPPSQPWSGSAVETADRTYATSTTTASCIHGGHTSGSVDNPERDLSPIQRAALAALDQERTA